MYPLERRKGIASSKRRFVSRRPLPAIDFDRSASNNLFCHNTVIIYFILACGFAFYDSSTPGPELSDLAPLPPQLHTPPSLTTTWGKFQRLRPRIATTNVACRNPSLLLFPLKSTPPTHQPALKRGVGAVDTGAFYAWIWRRPSSPYYLLM